ncbi:TetR/AcrR family transcriptional regulator [Antrihabitans sp. YC2-6]|uniref:TetR/AcrR family transcriptional regulator n=1 Tax=Antrihabitans sp. YC2-6 TaxID=2799498 RepID=UPI0018F50004|nr:TetR/AcrR family transcriptional regulator [Antrihabitans sp. YC2-6]MBJ8344247.1 TetR/AcrR family transcriptional regulator [Antrihabitans sp. YC2-6]
MAAVERSTPAKRSYGGRSSEQRSDERRERLKAAALQLFGSQGYAVTSIEQLCATANVSTRSFYEEMGSRESLLIALVEEITARAAAAALAALAAAAEEPLADRITRSFEAYLAVTCRDHRSARVCYVEVVGVSATVEKWRIGWRERMSAVILAEIERAVERDEARGRNYRLFPVAVIGIVNSLAQEFAVTAGGDEAVSVDEICAEVAVFVTGALAQV